MLLTARRRHAAFHHDADEFYDDKCRHAPRQSLSAQTPLGGCHDHFYLLGRMPAAAADYYDAHHADMIHMRPF